MKKFLKVSVKIFVQFAQTLYIRFFVFFFYLLSSKKKKKKNTHTHTQPHRVRTKERLLLLYVEFYWLVIRKDFGGLIFLFLLKL